MVRPAGFEAEPVKSTKVVPRFDGTGDGYWWLIQVDRYLEVNTWLCEERKVRWVTTFAFSGDAFSWWFNWNQGKQNITWEQFERAFIEKFIPDLWEMLEAGEGEEKNILNEAVDNEEDSMEVGNKTVIPSVTEFIAQPNSECHKESVTGSYVLFETEALGKMKIKGSEEATTSVEEPNLFKEEEISQTREDQVTVCDRQPPPEPPDYVQRVISFQWPATLDGESLRTVFRLLMAKSPCNQTTGEQALLKEEEGSQKMQVVSLSVTITPPPKPPECHNTGLGVMVRPTPEMMTVSIMVTTDNSISGERVRFNGVLVWKDLEKLRAKGEFAVFVTYVNPVGQIPETVGVLSEIFTEWAGAKAIKLTQCYDNTWIQDKGGTVSKFYHDVLEIFQSKGKGPVGEFIALHQLLKQIPSGTILKKEGQYCFIMLALNKRIMSSNLKVKVSGSALLIWAAKEEEESCSYSPFSIEVMTTKGFVVGEVWLLNSTFISGYGQQERYVAAFDYFIKMQYDDSPVLLNENVTHGCVVRICIDRDVFLQTVNDKGYGQNGDFEFVFKMMSLHSWVLPKQRNSGKFYYPLIITWFEYCWRSFPTLYSQLNLIYNRGKIWLKSICGLVMLVYDRGKFLSPSIWVQLMSSLCVLKHSAEPSDVNRAKLEVQTALANERNTCETVTKLCEYVAKVDIPIAREVIRVIGKMALQQYDVNVVIPLFQFHEMEKRITTRLLVPDIEGFVVDYSVKGIFMLLEIAALTILEVANKLDCFLVKKVTDDEIFCHLLVVEGNCNMPPNNVYWWSGNKEMVPYTTMWKSLINEFPQQGMCVEVLKYFRNMRFLVHRCSRIFMSWFIACADPLVLPNGKEVNVCSLRSLVDRNHLLSAAFIEMLKQFWNTVMGTLRRMNPMALTIYNYCWSELFIFHGLPNFVFDRGKVMWKQISTLRTRLF
jgi:hypothetical protein